MHIHPQFDPIIHINIRWYAMAYVLGFIIFLYFGKKQIQHGVASIRSVADLDSLFFYGVLGVILGGRLGYVVFYNASEYLSNPADIFKVWQGGMSFHGGLIGVIIAVALFALIKKYKFLEVSDFIVPYIPIGLGLGRLGNFINGELWGRITEPGRFWAMGFPQAREMDINKLPNLPESYQQMFSQFGILPRHPSQLYELVLEGIVLGLIVFLFTRKKRPMGQISAVFLIGYGILRFIVEFSREPDAQLGLLSLDFSMGQWLSIPMILIGILMYTGTIRKNPI